MADQQAQEVPKPLHAEGAKKAREGKEGYQLKENAGSALHEDESEKEAFHRINKRVYNVMLPHRQQYDPEIQEIKQAYEAVVQDIETNKKKKVYPVVFMLTDSKLAKVLAHRPRPVFEHDFERQKMPLLEDAYQTFMHDVDGGVDLDSVDYTWHEYNELYGWSIKRIWFETDTVVCYDPTAKKDENGEIVYSADGLPEIEYKRKMYRHGMVKHRVYEPDMVAVDPAGRFLFQCRDIVFWDDISYDEFEQQYKFNPTFNREACDAVEPGKLFNHDAPVLMEGTDRNGNAALVYGGSIGLLPDRVRIMSYYGLDRDEHYMTANNLPILHIPNPCPPNPMTGRKQLPAADLHDRLRPGTFYSMGEGRLQEAYITEYQKLLNAKSRRAQLAAAPVVLTDTSSGISPKSFRVQPGAHWRGMKGRAEILNLAGADTGEVSNYVEEIRNGMKVTSGNDFDRLIADPDPTAHQQASRDEASEGRIRKDLNRYESAHIRSMNITIQNIQFWMTIPEIADLADASEEEQAFIKEWDKLPKDEATGKQFYRKYPLIRTKGRRYIEEYDAQNERYKLRPDKKAAKDVDGLLPSRPEYLRTKGLPRVRAVSDRKQAANRQTQFENSSKMIELALTLPPKNEAAIAQATASQQPPPAPERYVNIGNAVENMIEALGGDVKKMTAPEGKTDLSEKPASRAVKDITESHQTLLPDETNDVMQFKSLKAPQPQNAPVA